MRTRRDTSARGVVLVLALFIVAVLSILAVSEMFVIRGEVGAAAAAHQGLQARAAAMSGIQRAMMLLWFQPNDTPARVDNPEVLQAQKVTGENVPDEPWYFTVYAANEDNPGTVRYGVEDEAGKINLYLASAETLLALPGMTPELLDCLMDYTDADSETRPQGAEQDYYDTLGKPYLIRNGPPATVEELLLVKGFTGQVVYGEDANFNGILDANEDDGDESFPPDNGDGVLDRGLRTFLTVSSYEPDESLSGQARININTADAGTVSNQLGQAGFGRQTRDFIAAARRLNIPFASPADLLGMELEVPSTGGGRGGRGGGGAARVTRLSSGVTVENLPLVMDRLTTGGIALAGQEILPGRVNINSAPKAVLLVLPGLTEDTAQRIVDLRGGLDEQERATPAWLYTREVLTAEAFKQVAPLVTARSFQFRIRSVGYSLTSGRFCVLEAVADLASGRPRITYLRDLTRLGVPFSLAGMER